MKVENIDRFFCDLPTRPVHGKRILVTGASGCVGGLLIPVLLKRGYHVRIMVRTFSGEYQQRWPEAEIAVADVLEYPDLQKALQDIDCAYYLIHSLHMGKGRFFEFDRQAAINFRRAADENNLERIIYLGSLGDPDDDTLSEHLRSRMDVASQLQAGKTPVTFLRSAVIIGSHSTSYRIIKHLIRNCPLLLVPKWADTSCQPVAIRSVIHYLVGCLETPATTGRTFDIGGKSVLSYEMMLKTQATALGKRRIFLPSFISSFRFYARMASIFTPVRFAIIESLMESCANEVVCKEKDIRSLIPLVPLTYEEALAYASDVEKDRDPAHPRATIPTVPPGPPTRSKWPLSDVKRFLLHKPAIPTLIKFNTQAERENYSYRIVQRLGVDVEKYKVLNIHRIGINAPAKYVFEELLQWDADSTCWPNNIARITKIGNRLENLYIHLFGWTRFPSWLRIFFGTNMVPLFKLDAIHIQTMPDEMSSDNERYLLYKSSGGYPIGIFSMYVRSPIADQGEKQPAQLFLLVGFNFYGRKKGPRWNPLHKLWEIVHDRVTSNVLNRIKQLSEWRFSRIQHGGIRSEDEHATVNPA